MNPAHILFPLLVAAFAIPAIISFRTARTFSRTARRIPGVVAGIESDGYSEAGKIRPTIRVSNSSHLYIIRDLSASDAKAGDAIEVYVSEKFDYAYHNIGFRFWRQPILMAVFAAALASAYSVALIK